MRCQELIEVLSHLRKGSFSSLQRRLLSRPETYRPQKECGPLDNLRPHGRQWLNFSAVRLPTLVGRSVGEQILKATGSEEETQTLQAIIQSLANNSSETWIWVNQEQLYEGYVEKVSLVVFWNGYQAVVSVIRGEPEQ